MRGKRVAILVHPLHVHGGAEYHLKVISDLFPDATIFTAWYDEEFVQKYFPGRKIKASFIQNLPNKSKYAQLYIPLQPFAYKLFNFDQFHKVIILSDGFEKNIKVGPGVKILLEVLTPPRFLWLESRSTQRSNKISYKIYKKFLEKALHSKWRKIDKTAASKADIVLANSHDVQSRIAKFYGLHSEVLYPPVETSDIPFNPMLGNRKDWYLYFGRVETYKGVELLIRTCIAFGHKLKVAGSGADLERMKQLTIELGGANLIEIMGYVTEKQKKQLLFECKALIYPVKDEDFGIVPLEASAAGAPVVAFRGGGVKETVLDGKTGVFFDQFDIESLNNAIKRVDQAGINPDNCLAQANSFKKETFESKFMTFFNNL